MTTTIASHEEAMDRFETVTNMWTAIIRRVNAGGTGIAIAVIVAIITTPFSTDCDASRGAIKIIGDCSSVIKIYFFGLTISSLEFFLTPLLFILSVPRKCILGGTIPENWLKLENRSNRITLHIISATSGLAFFTWASWEVIPIVFDELSQEKVSTYRLANHAACIEEQKAFHKLEKEAAQTPS
jgi:hypothetical protein